MILEFPNGFMMPIWIQQAFSGDSDLERYFHSLPEEVQKALINEDIHSERSLRDSIERYKLKE